MLKKRRFKLCVMTRGCRGKKPVHPQENLGVRRSEKNMCWILTSEQMFTTNLTTKLCRVKRWKENSRDMFNGLRLKLDFSDGWKVMLAFLSIFPST